LSNLSRVRFLGAGTALAAFGPALLTPFIAAAAQASEGDVKILNVALKLERAGIKAYEDSVKTGLLSPGVLTVAKGFMNDHIAHRDALIGAIKAAGETPTSETTKLDYPTLASESDILKFAEGVEKGAVTTYLSVISSFTDRSLAKVAASILGIEATHVGTLASALKEATPYKGFVS
jgi:VIT1/CCC1 family predicted Fe2+/Mn2+ transporter